MRSRGNREKVPEAVDSDGMAAVTTAVWGRGQTLR